MADEQRNDLPDEYADEVQKEAATVAVVALLAAGFAPAALLQGLIALLMPLGIPPAVTIQLFRIVGYPGLSFAPPAASAGPVATVMGRGVVARRSMYVVTAGKRMAEGGSVKTEQRLYGAHLAAETRRAKAAEQLDAAALQFGDVLGWKAVLDERTTPLCRAAHGRNFSASRPPQIGYPGVAHGGQCRCRARRPWANGEMLP